MPQLCLPVFTCGYKFLFFSVSLCLCGKKENKRAAGGAAKHALAALTVCFANSEIIT
jgi:hypothetical protein